MKARCPHCDRELTARAARGGDGSAVHVVRHLLEGGAACPGTYRLIDLADTYEPTKPDLQITRVGDDPDLPEYEVALHGAVIGRVFKGWWRTGGTGWGHSITGTTKRVASTRAAAGADLILRHNRGERA